MMKKAKLGKAFHSYLEYLEGVEVMMGAPDHKKTKIKVPQCAINQNNFESGTDFDFAEASKQLMLVDAALAPVVRSGVKYKVSANTLVEIATRYEVELDYISNTVPQRLPFEWCVLIIEDFGTVGDFVITATETTPQNGEDYDDLGIAADEKFICLNFAGYLPKGVKGMNNNRHATDRISNIPVEMHMHCGELEMNNHALYAPIDNLKITEDGRRLLGILYRSFCLWLAQFELQSVLRQKSPGAPPSPGKIERRHKKRKKAQHPQFEHTVIKLEVDAPEATSTGLSILQSKKRMHAVRGHWRKHPKTDERVFVKGHWRGDKELGVVRRDVELVTHENCDADHGQIITA